MPQIAQKSHSQSGAAVAKRPKPIIDTSVGMSSQWGLKCPVPGAQCPVLTSNARGSSAAIVIITTVQCGMKSITRKIQPLPYKNAVPRSIGPRA